MKRVIQCAALAMSMCGVSVMTTAAEISPSAHIVVSYGDLDLTRAEGLNRLQARIESAAERVCAELDSRAPDRHVLFAKCKQAALNEAISQVALPALTSRYASN